MKTHVRSLYHVVILVLAGSVGCFWSPASVAPKKESQSSQVNTADAIRFPESEEPSEERNLQLLQCLLADAGVNANVRRFRRTGESRYTGVASCVAGDKCYAASYEAELEFGGDCRIQEDWSLLWHPEAKVNGDSGERKTPRVVRQFHTGDRQEVKGILHWHVRQGNWEQVSRPNQVGRLPDGK